MAGENYFKAAYSYLYIRDFERATDAFRHAIESDPENPCYYFHASVTALRNGHRALALQWARRATELDPDDPLYRAHLGVVKSNILADQARSARDEGDLTRARLLWLAALRHDPLNEEADVALHALPPVEAAPGLGCDDRHGLSLAPMEEDDI